jgi:Fe-S-cluster containining protein
MNSAEWQAGLHHLKHPLWPLTKLCILLYLTSPYETWEELLQALPPELSVDETIYEDPASKLTHVHMNTRWLELLRQGSGGNGLPVVINEGNDTLDMFSTVLCLLKQQVMEAELETVNSLFCASMKCALCCKGPEPDAVQEFFEIPLQPQELSLFAFQPIETPFQGGFDACSADIFQIDERPFYLLPPAVYHWRHGYSLILTKGASCPHLTGNMRCNIYEKRPNVCRKPQIFAYVLEQQPDKPHVSLERDTLLAITDCPYVRLLEKELERYAVLNEVTLMLKPNKA